VKVIHVARKPLNGTVAQNALKHGTGALNIERSRVHFEGEQDQEAAFPGGALTSRKVVGGGLGCGWKVHQREAFRATQPTGRWPANLVLEHKPGCRRTGTKRVTGTSGSASKPGVAVRKSGVHSKAGGHNAVGAGLPRTGHAEGDGLETTDAWECVPGCPVAALDEQSGLCLVSGSAKTGKRPTAECGFGWSGGTKVGCGSLHNDSGGASRFYKQFQGEEG